MPPSHEPETAEDAPEAGMLPGQHAVLAAVARRRLRIFSAPAGQAPARRAGDVLIAIPALVGLLLLVWAQPPGRLEGSADDLFDAVPSWLDPAWGFLYDLLILWAVALIVAAAGARRWAVAAQAVGALLAMVLIALAATRLATGDWPSVVDAVQGGDAAPAFPAMRLAEAAAVAVTVSGHLVRPLQRLGRWLVALGAAGALFVTDATPGGVLAAVLVAVLAACAIRLLFGTSIGRPGLEDVRASLAELGVPTAGLHPLERQPAGVFVVRGTDAAGAPIVTRVHGRDAYDSRLLETLWRGIWYRESGPAPGTGPARSVEHEALMTLLAANAGVPTPRVLTAGETVGGDALLVLGGRTVPLEEIAADAVGDDDLRAWWDCVAGLERGNVAHLRIDTTALVHVDGVPGLADFGGAVVAPSADQRMTDRAQLLAATAAAVGPDRALGAAEAAIGADGVAALGPYLQSAAFGRRLRQAVRDAGLDVDDLRAAAAIRAGVTPAEPVRMRRVTVWSAAQAGLLVLAASAVIGFFGDIEWDEVRGYLENASWAIFALGFVMAQVPRFTQAVATLGSVPVRLPYWPVYAMQLTTNYLNLALPSYVGRMAVSIRFFQRQALSPALAVTSGVIESTASFVVQVSLVTLILLFTDAHLQLDLGAPDTGDLGGLVWIVGGLLVVSVPVVAFVPRVRDPLRERLHRWLPEVRSTFAGLRGRNKIGLLVLGNVATEVLFATALGLFARGIGYDIGLAELILINTGVSLVSGFIPVPGGIGVTEFGLTVGLTGAGMPEEAALAAVVLYRLASFYIPPAWGFFAMRWLQRNRYL